MSVLTGPVYQLVKGDLIQAMVQGASLVAFGPLSDPNLSGAIAEYTPLVPGTPVRGSLTSHLVLHVVWPTIADHTEASGGLTT
jgi:hypothetical protein